MTRRSIAIVIQEGVQALDITGPLDVFTEANRFLPEDDGYDCSVVGEKTTPMQTSSALLVCANVAFQEAKEPFHTVLVAGGPKFPSLVPSKNLSNWLEDACQKAKRYGSVCTGAFTLGHIKLLDGRHVTTHWENAHQLANLFSQAYVNSDKIYIQDGPLVTSAGVTAGIDLALALVAADHGPSIALSCAKRLVVIAQRQGGQSQFSPLLLPQMPQSSPLGNIQAYVLEHFSEPLSVKRLANLGGVSERGLARLFMRDLNVTPRDYVEAVRLTHARNLLEATELAIKTIAFKSGFSSPEQMRVVFQKKLDVSPLQYRENFRTIKYSQ